MSQLAKIDTVKQIVQSTEAQFKRLAHKVGAINYEREQVFAINALKDNEYLCGVAYNNKDSLRRAVLNVAAVGLSLNPIKRHAYLIPREGKVCLDISYQGMIQLALDIGAIKWAKAEIVYSEDEFQFTGINELPVHKFNPFSKDRGEIVGAYCVAKTPGGEYLAEIMPIEDIYSIRDRSVAWKSYKAGKAKSCPWATDPGEMIKKTVIRRAYKSWPMTESKERFEKAIDVTQDDHEIDVKHDTQLVEASQEDRKKQIETIKGQIEFLGREEEASLEFLTRTCQRKITAFEDLTQEELDHFESMMEQFVNQKLKDEKNDEN